MWMPSASVGVFELEGVIGPCDVFIANRQRAPGVSPPCCRSVRIEPAISSLMRAISRLVIPSSVSANPFRFRPEGAATDLPLSEIYDRVDFDPQPDASL
jgi:hypothetical protein